MKLYHYTSLEKFSNIWKGEQFNLSLFENANDSKEKLARTFESGESINDYKYISTCAGENRRGMEIQSFANNMLWHYYGDKITGVCIEFDSYKLCSAPEKPLKCGMVKYRRGVTHIDNQPILKYLMEKRPCWRGEYEYRLIYKKEVTCIKNIRSYITAIYIGLNYEEALKELSSLNITCDIYKISIDGFDGRLNRHKIKNDLCSIFK